MSNTTNPYSELPSYERGRSLADIDGESPNTSPTNIVLGDRVPTASIPIIIGAPHADGGHSSRFKR